MVYHGTLLDAIVYHGTSLSTMALRLNVPQYAIWYVGNVKYSKQIGCCQFRHHFVYDMLHRREYTSLGNNLRGFTLQNR